jgi:hypothetical protein
VAVSLLQKQRPNKHKHKQKNRESLLRRTSNPVFWPSSSISDPSPEFDSMGAESSASQRDQVIADSKFQMCFDLT